jgi:hypothetical protein
MKAQNLIIIQDKKHVPDTSASGLRPDASAQKIRPPMPAALRLPAWASIVFSDVQVNNAFPR